MTGILTINNLTKIYRGKEAIQNISLTIKKATNRGSTALKNAMA